MGCKNLPRAHIVVIFGIENIHHRQCNTWLEQEPRQLSYDGEIVFIAPLYQEAQVEQCFWGMRQAPAKRSIKRIKSCLRGPWGGG